MRISNAIESYIYNLDSFRENDPHRYIKVIKMTHAYTHVWHAHTHTYTHLTLFFSPCCTPCICSACATYRCTQKLCPFELFFGYGAFTGLLIQPLSQLFVTFSFSLCLVLHVQITTYFVIFYFFSGHNCISTKMV